MKKYRVMYRPTEKASDVSAKTEEVWADELARGLRQGCPLCARAGLGHPRLRRTEDPRHAHPGSGLTGGLERSADCSGNEPFKTRWLKRTSDHPGALRPRQWNIDSRTAMHGNGRFTETNFGHDVAERL